MNRRLFNFGAGASLAVLAVLICGFFGRFGVMVQNNAATGRPPFYQETSAILEEGRCRLWIETWNAPPQAAAPVGRNFKWVGSVFDIRLPKPARATVEFDAHFIGPEITKGSLVLILACPIWCIAAPFCVLPWMWFRKWRQRRLRVSEQWAGFPVS